MLAKAFEVKPRPVQPDALTANSKEPARSRWPAGCRWSEEADPLEVFPYHRKAWILEAKYLADEQPTPMPANIAARVYSAGQKFSGQAYLECEEVSRISAPRRAPIEAACGV
jgi:hypothetical protein